MSHELSLKPDSLLSLVEQRGLGDVIRPLSRQIHLFDSNISGNTWLKDCVPPDSLAPGDRLLLRREDSRFDSNAIRILNERGEKLGYVPERDNLIFARLMDAGKLLEARVTEIIPAGSYTQVNIGIYLIDF